MSEHTEKIEDVMDLITPQWVNNAIVGGMLLTDAIDFMKKIGVLDEFMNTLKPLDQQYIIGLLKCRPKELGENPFE